MTAVYLIVWLATGVVAYFYGVIMYPKVLQPLTDLGQAQFGIAIAAGYAYFGIKQT